MHNSRAVRTRFANCLRFSCAATLGAAIVLCSPNTPHAQRAQEPELRVTGIDSRKSDGGTVVSIAADGNLRRAQTWQDENGDFHVVLPKGQSALPPGAARGLKMQRVGNSLEIVVPAKRGSTVTVQPRFNRLELIVKGGLQEEGREQSGRNGNRRDSRAQAARVVEGSTRQNNVVERAERQYTKQRQESAPTSPARNASPERAEQPARSVESDEGREQNQQTEATGAFWSVPRSGQSLRRWSTRASSRRLPGAAPWRSPRAQPQSSREQIKVNLNNQPQSSLVFSLTGLIGLAGLSGLGAFIFVRRRRRVVDDGVWEDVETKEEAPQGKKEAVETAAFEQTKGDRRKHGDRRFLGRSKAERRKSGLGAESPALLQSLEDNGGLTPKGGQRPDMRGGFAASVPAVMFGAFRIDQEVAKLVQGEAHSIDVLASRANDDRRAVETSLIKVLRSVETDERVRHRARTALEEYGLVARQSAALLLAPEACDRASAARTLGEIKSSASLPFLLEALYDPESVVRSEVVASLGSLGLPRAIGPMIDVARRYPEMSANLLAPALSACSVEAVDFSWNSPNDSRTFAVSSIREAFTGEIIGLEPTSEVEQLPEWLEDETLAEALERLESVDVEARIAAAQSLSQYQVRPAVDALSAMATRDADPIVRATAVTSLGTIDHESVFAPVLLAMADEAREVRAAAARSLSRLSFDRADAYVRVIETSDGATLRRVAEACIKAGVVAQALDRLTSTDRRQAYEAFSVLSLVVKGGESRPIIEVIEYHGDIEVRLAALKLMCMMSQPEALTDALKELVTRGGQPQKVRDAITEALECVQQMKTEAQ